MKYLSLATTFMILLSASPDAFSANKSQGVKNSIYIINSLFNYTSNMPNPKKDAGGDVKILCTHAVFHKWAKQYLKVLDKTPVTTEGLENDLNKLAITYFRYPYKSAILDFFRPGASALISNKVDELLLAENNNKSLEDTAFDFNEIQEKLYNKMLMKCITNEVYGSIREHLAKPDPTKPLPEEYYIPKMSVSWTKSANNGIEPHLATESENQESKSFFGVSSKPRTYSWFIRNINN